MKRGYPTLLERWLLAYLRTHYSDPDNTVANVHERLGRQGVVALGDEQNTRRAFYELEKAGLVRREAAGAVWLWEAVEDNRS